MVVVPLHLSLLQEQEMGATEQAIDGYRQVLDREPTNYDALDAIGAVAEFGPYQEGKKPPFVFDQIYGPITYLSRFERPGPEVKIYRLN